MPATYEPIATTTLGTEAANITFSSISSAYTDLRLVFVGIKPATGNTSAQVQLNSDTGANYSWTNMNGNGTTAASSKGTSDSSIPLVLFSAITTTNPQMGTMDLMSYSGSTYKTVLVNEASDKNGSGVVARTVGLWRSTSAINSIKIYDGSSRNFGIGTTATLYGILKA